MTSFQRAKGKGGNEPWRNRERHYCALCNAWMGSDRQSIMLHENGKKHREAVEEDLTRRRDEKKKREKERKGLESVFAQVNAAVGIACPPAPASFGSAKPWDVPARGTAPRGGKPLPPTQQKKRARDEPKPSAESEPANGGSKKPTETVFDPNVGHYAVEGTTYLEGGVYCNVLEEGMPIQLWTGSAAASDGEKRDLRNCNKWRVALLAKVAKRKRGDVACHVSYLLKADDDDETMESDVPPSRIRLVLGSDPSIPSTMEEAHLALMGGEQTIHVADGKDAGAEIDENTGLSGWSTTTIRKVSSRFEQDQEKKRRRRHERELAERREKKEREVQARRMEEAKHANAHDSALGAYDVWSSSNTGIEGRARAYKGIDVTKEAKLEVADTAKSLSKGMGNVAFKKKKAKKRNVRKTSADDV